MKLIEMIKVLLHWGLILAQHSWTMWLSELFNFCRTQTHHLYNDIVGLDHL